MERARRRDPPGCQPSCQQAAHRDVDRVRRTGDHGLFRRVAIGDHDIGQLRPTGGQHLLNRPGGGGHRGHRPQIVGPRETAGGIQDGSRPRRAEQQKIINVDDAGRAQGDQLAVAVAAEVVGMDPEPGEDLVHGKPRHPENRLRRTCIGDRLLLGGCVRTGEGSRREHRLHPLLTTFEQVPQTREGHEHIRQHPGPLAALAGEEKGNLPASIRVTGRPGAGRISRPGIGRGRGRGRGRNEDPRFRVMLECPRTPHQVGQVIEGGRDEGHLNCPTAPARDRRGQVTQFPGPPGAIVDHNEFGELVQGAASRDPVGTSHDKKLRRPWAQAVRGLGPTVVGRQHHMEVRPTETERGHTGVPA